MTFIQLAGEVSQIAFIRSINTILMYRHFGKVRKKGMIETCKLNIEEETQLLTDCRYPIDLPQSTKVYSAFGSLAQKLRPNIVG